MWKEKYARPAVERSRLWEYNRYVLASTSDSEARMRLRRDAAAQEKFYAEHGLPAEASIPEGPMAHVTDLADTIDYLIRIAGEEHVGLGGDVNGIVWHQWPADMRHVDELPRLTAELLRRGYNERKLRMLYSGNWRRVYARTMP